MLGLEMVEVGEGSRLHGQIVRQSKSDDKTNEDITCNNTNKPLIMPLTGDSLRICH